MSGGYFDYQQYRAFDIAAMIDELVESNDDTSLDEYGSCRGRGYEPETIAKFKEASKVLKRAAVMAQRIDWLVSGDDGEDTFHRRWNEEVGKIDALD